MPENPSRTVGYLRVSTDNQDLDKNRADILTLANKEELGRVELFRTDPACPECAF